MADGDEKLEIVAQQVALLTRDSAEVKQRLDKVDQRLDKVDQRLDKVDQRLDKVDQRLDNIEHGQQELKVDLGQHTNAILGEMRKLIGVLDDKIDAHIHDPNAHTA